MNKLQEEKIFKLFCKSQNIESDLFENSESPDFVNTKESLGYELTEYHIDSNTKGSKARENEALLGNIINEALKLYQQKSKNNNNVYFSPSTSALRKPVNVKTVAKKLSEFILSNNSGDCSTFFYPIVKPNIKDACPSIPKGLNMFSYIIIHQTESHITWSLSEAGSSEANFEALQKIINKKEKKIKMYQNNVGEVSLVIHASDVPCIDSSIRGSNSRFARITERLVHAVFKSSFKKVYFFSEADNNSIELNINH